ncbi:MAG: efflux RND transporter periplasmic adaptor subunit [Bacteriovoracia bacterium]
MLKNKIFLYLIGAFAVVAITLTLFNKNNEYQTHVIEKNDFIESAEIAGKIIPAQELNLSFEVAGKVSRVYVDTGDNVQAGDILVELDTTEVSSELSEVIANLEREQSRLAEVSGEITSKNKLQNSAENLLQTIEKSYVSSDDIVKNSVDKFFDNPNNRFPDFSNSLGDYFLRQEINDQRYEIGGLLEEWKRQINSLDSAIIDNKDADDTISNLRQIESFLSKITSDVDKFSPTSSVTQTEIDSYINSISNARNNVSSLIIEVTSAYNNFRDVQAELPVLESSINNARATVDKLSARKQKYALYAPFDGIITEQDIELGQVVSVNETVLSMISDEAFDVEGFVPELNIIGVEVGDEAILSLDAFGDDTKFKSEISHVDPRETIKDGVTTYRVLLNLLEGNEQIRSGMTVNVEIIKEIIKDQIIIPRYLIQENENGSYVKLYVNDKTEDRQIKVGKTDGKGGVVVLEGLEVGEEIIIKN